MANTKYLAGPGGRFDLADPDTKRMVQAVMANPADAPKYGASLAEIFQLQKMLERISTPMPAPQTTTVYDDLKNAALQQASSGMLGESPAQSGLMGLPVHNFREENYAGGGIVAFNGEDNDQLVEKESSPFGDLIRGIFNSPERQAAAMGNIAQYKENIRRNKLRPGYFESMTPSERTRRQTEYDAIQAVSPVGQYGRLEAPAGYAEAEGQRGIATLAPGMESAAPTAAPAATPTGAPVRPVRPAGLAAAPGAAAAAAAPAVPSQGETLLKEAQAERNKRVEEARPKDRATYRSEIEEEYKAAGIGGADKAEKERIAEQRARAKEQYGRNIDLAGFMAGMKMAAAASRRGATFLGSAAEGGSEFGARYGKAMEDMSAMQAKLDDKETNLARLEEARKMGIIDKTDARLKEARAEYKDAQNQALNLQEKSAELIYGRDVQERISKLDRESRERVANLQVAATREGHYNAFRDLMSRLDKAPKEQHAAIIAQFEKASGAVGAGYAADRRAASTQALAFQRDPEYRKLAEKLAQYQAMPTSNPTIKKQMTEIENRMRMVESKYGASTMSAADRIIAGES